MLTSYKAKRVEVRTPIIASSGTSTSFIIASILKLRKAHNPHRNINVIITQLFLLPMEGIKKAS